MTHPEFVPIRGKVRIYRRDLNHRFGLADGEHENRSPVVNALQQRLLSRIICSCADVSRHQPRRFSFECAFIAEGNLDTYRSRVLENRQTRRNQSPHNDFEGPGLQCWLHMLGNVKNHP